MYIRNFDSEVFPGPEILAISIPEKRRIVIAIMLPDNIKAQIPLCGGDALRPFGNLFMGFLIDFHLNNTKVDSSITKHIPNTKHFPMLSSFINQIERTLCHWTRKLEGYICSLNVSSKGATWKAQEEDD
jgi:hypothetical protein